MNLLPLLVLIPLAGAFLSFLLPRYEKTISIGAVILLSFVTLFLGNIVFHEGPIKLVAGGWTIPLGIGLYADGLTILMLALSCIVAMAVSIYALVYFDDHKQNSNNKEKPSSWWPI